MGMKTITLDNRYRQQQGDTHWWSTEMKNKVSFGDVRYIDGQLFYAHDIRDASYDKSKEDHVQWQPVYRQPQTSGDEPGPL